MSCATNEAAKRKFKKNIALCSNANVLFDHMLGMTLSGMECSKCIFYTGSACAKHKWLTSIQDPKFACKDYKKIPLVK